MPIYDYHCPNCKKPFEDISSITAKDAGLRATCPNCDHLCTGDDRDFSKSTFNFIGTAVTSPEFNPGLGCVVKNKRHKDDLLKKKGLVEVGNDFNGGERMQKHFDKQKQDERERAWKNELGEI